MAPDGWRARAVTLSVAVTAAAVGLATGYALVALVGRALAALSVAMTPARAVLLSIVLLQGVSFGGVALGVVRLRGRPPLHVGVPDLREALWVAAAYVLALVGAISVALVVVLSGLSPARNRAAELGQADPLVFLLLVPASLLLVGPGEELLFRGVVQGTLRGAFGAPAAVGLATALFAVAHVGSLAGPFEGRLLTVGMLFVPGLALGVAYEATGNLVVPALVHGAYNATLFGLAYASSTVGGGGAAGPDRALVDALAAVPSLDAFVALDAVLTFVAPAVV